MVTLTSAQLLTYYLFKLHLVNETSRLTSLFSEKYTHTSHWGQAFMERVKQVRTFGSILPESLVTTGAA